MITYVFKITCLTNLHVGRGDAGGYGVVDKEVQRDTISNLPTIHASSLKGALREYFKTESWVTAVFGSSNNPEDREEAAVQRGNHRFFAADFLAIPTPADEAPYYERVKSQVHEQTVRTKLIALGAKALPESLLDAEKNADKFKTACDDLPVIARNQLENGVSKNLWYEEVVPRQSVFLMAIQSESESELVKKLDHTIVQIGGNATVGYGYCKFTLLSPPKSA